MKSKVLVRLPLINIGASIIAVMFLFGCSIVLSIDDDSGDDYEAGNGDVISEEWAVEDFHGVKLGGVGDVKVRPGESYKVMVTTDSNLQDKVLITVKGGNLHITQESQGGLRHLK